MPGSTGNFAVTGVGFQPKITFFFYNERTSDGTLAAGFIAMGFAHGSTERLSSWKSIDNNSGSSNDVEAFTNAIVSVPNPGGGVPSVATYVSDDADGFTLNFSTADATARIVDFLCIGGADITNVASGNGTTPSATGNSAVSTVGFQPDVIFTMVSANDAFNVSGATNFRSSLGWANASGSEGTCGIVDGASSNPTACYKYQRTSACISMCAQDGSKSMEGSFVSMDSGGFTINYTTASARPYQWVAIKGGQWKAHAFNQATSTGNVGTTGVGFQPLALLLQSFGAAAATTIQNSLRWTIGAGTSSSSRAAIWTGGTHNVATTVYDNALSRTKIYISYAQGTPTLESDADLVSLDSDGHTLNYTTADATARQILGLAIGSNAGGGGGGNPWNYYAQAG